MPPFAFFSAYVLDLILGDPQWFPHPVRLIGRLISFLERLFRRPGSSPRGLRVFGILLVVVVLSITWFTTHYLIRWAGDLFWAAGFTCSVFLGYTTLATRDLHVETRKVLLALAGEDISRARRELSLLVGRDTANLDEPEILRALVETIAENTSDGVIAPLFCLGLGGPPLAMTYKALNTLDSMVGYKNERFRDLGWASAKLDDVANFIPARLSGFLITFSALLLGKSWRDSLRILWRDRRNHESPNSVWPEGAMAGALGVRLGGVNHYFGQPSLRPFIGDQKKDLELSDVQEAWKILYLSSFWMLLLSLLLIWVAAKILSW